MGTDRVIRRVLPDGRVAARYVAPPGSGGWVSAIDLTPDGRGFWAPTPRAARGYQVELSSGRIVQTIGTGATSFLDIAVLGAPWGVAPVVEEKPNRESLDVDGVFPLTDQVASTLATPGEEPSNPCASDVGGTLAYSSRGRSVGPYTGDFEASGRTAFGQQSLRERIGPLGLAPGPISSLTGDFTIRSAGGVVRGRVTFAGARGDPGANVAACARFANRVFPGSSVLPPNVPLSGYYWGLNARTLRYDATIQKNGRVYRDRGTSHVFTDEYHLTESNGRLAGLRRQYTQAWSSQSFGVTDRFTGDDQVRRHTAGLSSATKVVTLQVRWNDPRDSFSVTGIRLVDAGPRSLQSAGKLKPRKLKPRDVRVQVTPVKGGVNVRITKLKPRRLAFAIKARRVTGSARVSTDVRRSG